MTVRKDHRFGPDWDEPSLENEELCSRFGYEELNSISPMSYRLFVPDTAKKVPVVIYLHGADAYGNDNESHLAIHDIGTVFVKDSWQQKNPCYVIAPQCRPGEHWAYPVDDNRVCEIISNVLARYSNADPDRIYIYGYSAGGVGTLGLIKAYPEIFAAAISICGATNGENLNRLCKVPLWLVHAADDHIIRNSYQRDGYSSGGFYGSKDLYEYLKDRHKDIHFTEYPDGYMKEHYGVNPHCSWVAAGEHEEAKRWMFWHRKTLNPRA